MVKGERMKTLSFNEFRRYCDGKRIKRIIYNTDNNSRIKDAANCVRAEALHISFSFETIGFVSPTPQANMIYLSTPVGAIRLNNVQKVVLNNFPSWDEARIYCKSGDKITVYNLLIDY